MEPTGGKGCLAAPELGIGNQEDTQHKWLFSQLCLVLDPPSFSEEWLAPLCKPACSICPVTWHWAASQGLPNLHDPKFQETSGVQMTFPVGRFLSSVQLSFKIKSEFF